MKGNNLQQQISELESYIERKRADLSEQTHAIKKKIASPQMLAKALLAGFTIGFFLLPHKKKTIQSKNKKNLALLQTPLKKEPRNPIGTTFFKTMIQVLKLL